MICAILPSLWSFSEVERAGILISPQTCRCSLLHVLKGQFQRRGEGAINVKRLETLPVTQQYLSHSGNHTSLLQHNREPLLLFCNKK